MEPHCDECDYRGIPNYPLAVLGAINVEYGRAGRNCSVLWTMRSCSNPRFAEHTKELITTDVNGRFVVDPTYHESLTITMFFDDLMRCIVEFTHQEIKCVRWTQRGKLHHPTCPAVRVIDGTRTADYFINKGKFRRRDDQPNHILRDNGVLRELSWYTGTYAKRRYSRYTGPALVTYDSDGETVVEERYFIAGTEYSKADWMHKTGSVTK